MCLDKVKGDQVPRGVGTRHFFLNASITVFSQRVTWRTCERVHNQLDINKTPRKFCNFCIYLVFSVNFIAIVVDAFFVVVIVIILDC